MEKQNKKIFSTILMLVGVLCIVISGGIFVSRTWQYLPEVVKKLCLAAVTAGFFGGSFALEKRTGLRKAPLALYYLGVCFTGFSALAFLSGTSLELSGRLLLAMLAMSVPVVLRFLKEKGLADFLIQICLTDAMILCVAQLFALHAGRAAVLCLSAFTALLSGFVYYCRKELEGEKGLMIAGLVAYGIHGVLTLPFAFAGIFVWKEFLFSVLPSLLVTGSLTALYLVNRGTPVRLLQSGSILFSSFAASVYIIRLLPSAFVYAKFPAACFLAFFLCLIWMLVLGRREIAYANAVLTVLAGVLQVLQCSSRGFLPETAHPCYPYGICMAAATVIWYYFREADWTRRQMYEMAFSFLGLGLHLQAAWFWKEYATHYGIVLLVALAYLLLAFFLEQFRKEMGAGAALCKTFSLLLAVVAFLSNRILPVVFYAEDKTTVLADFGVEYDCIFVAVGIVLLGKIWYSRYQEIRLLQFVGTCVLLGAALLHDLAAPALPNVLFLGIVTLVMLVIATVLKNKKYAIASAAALVLIVLYLTREVWMSIAWWVYLFVAGVGLVIFAIKKEKAE